MIPTSYFILRAIIQREEVYRSVGVATIEAEELCSAGTHLLELLKNNLFLFIFAIAPGISLKEATLMSADL